MEKKLIFNINKMGKLKPILCKHKLVPKTVASLYHGLKKNLKDSHLFIRLSVNIVPELNGCFTLVFLSPHILAPSKVMPSVELYTSNLVVFSRKQASPHSHSIFLGFFVSSILHLVSPSLWQKCASSVSRSRRSAAE